MREAREALTVKLPCNMRALQLELFDVVTLTLPTFGFVAKEFEVLGWNFSIDAGVMLTLRETSAAIFDPGTGFATLDVAANTLLPKPWEVEQITGVTVTSGTTTEVDKSILVRTTVSWTAAVSDAVRKHGRIEVQYTRAGATLPSSDWPSVEAPGDATSVTITGLGQGVHYLFRVRARSNLGVRGLWSVTKTSQNAVVPQVDSEGLAANSAAEAVTTSISDGSFSWAAGSGLLGAQSTIGTYAWTNTLSRPVVIEVTFGGEGRSSGWGGTALARPSIGFGWSLSGGGSATKLIEVVDSAQPHKLAVWAQTVTVPVGNTVTLYFTVTNNPTVNAAWPAGTFEWIDSYIRACAVKA